MNIGMLNEKSLHASLKEWCAQPGDCFEVSVDGFVIDIVRDNLLMEIQTTGFSSIKSKLMKLLNCHRVRLIYPIAQEKWLVKLSRKYPNGISRRKSPKKGRLEDLFNELIRFPKLLANPNFSLEVLMIIEEEVRQYDEKRKSWRREWNIEDRRLIETVEAKRFENPADLLELIPDTLKRQFTTHDLMTTLGIRKHLAQKMAYCLRQAGVIVLIGKHSRFKLYEIAVPKNRAI